MRTSPSAAKLTENFREFECAFNKEKEMNSEWQLITESLDTSSWDSTSRDNYGLSGWEIRQAEPEVEGAPVLY